MKSSSLNLPTKTGTVTAMELLSTDRNNVFFRCVEDSYESIMLTDVKGALVYVNPAWQQIYEYSWDEAIGQTPRLLRSIHQSDETYKKMWDQILDPKVGYWRGELVNRSKSGKEIPVLLTITPFRKEGVIRGYMGIALDMSEKKAMETKIHLQDRLVSVGLLASGIAHEVGTPLGVIRARVELLKSQNKSNKQICESADIVVSQIERMSKLINNLLNLSRGHNQQGGRANVRTVIDEITSLLSQKIRQLGIDLVNEVPDNCNVKIGHNKLEQVYLNLIINSIHAIESEFKKGRKKNHKIALSHTQLDDMQILKIQDTGCGIEQQNFSNVFKPFFTTKDIGEGTGLGLSVSYQIINEAGGDISLESTVGQGTCFILQLPKA